MPASEILKGWGLNKLIYIRYWAWFLIHSRCSINGCQDIGQPDRMDVISPHKKVMVPEMESHLTICQSQKKASI